MCWHMWRILACHSTSRTYFSGSSTHGKQVAPYSVRFLLTSQEGGVGPILPWVPHGDSALGTDRHSEQNLDTFYKSLPVSTEQQSTQAVSASIAQWLETWSSDPAVVSSSPGWGGHLYSCHIEVSNLLANKGYAGTRVLKKKIRKCHLILRRQILG